MRVGMAVHAYYEKDARVRRYAEALVQAGHEVEVVALRDPGTKRVDTLCGVRVLRVPLSRKRGGTVRYLFEYFAFLVLAGWTLLRAHLAKPYRVVHVHNMPDFLVFAAFWPWVLGAKVVLDVHDLMPEVYSSKFKVSVGHAAIWPLRVQEWLSHRFAHRVIFATELFREIAVQRRTVRADRSISVLNAADLRLFDRRKHPWGGPGPGEFRVLYLGTISDRHGVDQAVRAVARLKGVVPGLKFVIYPRFAEGEGKPLEDLKRIVAEEKLEGIVEFRRPVPLEQVPAEIARANVGVFTPHLDVHIDIALSLKVPEYVAMSLPIVTTRTRIMHRYFAEDQVAYFDDGDIDGCAAAIRRIHDDPGAARVLAARADRFLEEHSWKKERERYFELLRGLVPQEMAPKPRDLERGAADESAAPSATPGRSAAEPAEPPAGVAPVKSTSTIEP